MTQQYECTIDKFLGDIKDHHMSILKDDGLFRFIRYERKGTNTYLFNLTTWPGHLCISGDMGTYVFSRIIDMFDFFRMDKNDFNNNPNNMLNINPGYWGEKLHSIGINAGYKVFDEDAFIKQITEYYDAFIIDNPDPDKELWEEITDQILNYSSDGKHAAISAIHNYSSSYGLDFTDFFDGGIPEKYTYHYIWVLYAIVWGIQQYDKSLKLI